MTKIEEHADHLLNAAADLRIAIKAKRYDEARQHAASVSKHRSVIIAIIEAVEELQPRSPHSEPPKRRYREGIKRSGDLSRYIRTHLNGMQPGEMKTIYPQGEFTIDRLVGCVSSLAATMWGSGNYTTQRIFSAERGMDGVCVLRG